jgi:FMN reductase
MTAPLVIVSGNPRPASRTLAVAESVATAAARAMGIESGAERRTIDLALYGAELFDWSSATVRQLADWLSAARLAVIASPTYKATYTGLLKAFLDWFPQTGLAGVVAVPVMVGAGPGHSLAVEVHLRPLLIEIGATVPTRGLYVTEDRLEDLSALIDEWLVQARPALHAFAQFSPSDLDRGG